MRPIPLLLAALALASGVPSARADDVAVEVLWQACPYLIGTAAAVYSLWFFCGEQWKSVYAETATSERRDPLSITSSDGTDDWEFTKQGDPASTYRTPPPPDWR